MSVLLDSTTIPSLLLASSGVESPSSKIEYSFVMNAEVKELLTLNKVTAQTSSVIMKTGTSLD
ncbi:hypothetical protein D3C76_1743110 [compost metagenome]